MLTLKPNLTHAADATACRPHHRGTTPQACVCVKEPRNNSLLYYIFGALAITTFIFVLAMGSAYAQRIIQTEKVPVQMQTIAKGLEHPWGLAFLPDDRFLVTERNSGRLRIGTPDGQLSEPVAGVPEVFRYEGPTDRSQGGLFDVAIHPEFENNRIVFLSFSQPGEEGAGTSIVRGRLVENGPQARLESVETIFSMNKPDSSGLHFGGRMAIDPRDNSLYLSIGDRRNISRAQDPQDHAGTIIRVRDDGSVPIDNPFVKNDKGDEKVFSYGHRNIQGLAIHPETGELWANGHGPKGGDMIHRIQPGRNYGWPFLTGGVDYSGAPIGVGAKIEGMESAVHIFEKTVAPSGLAFYTGDLFPQWRGDMLHGGLVARGIVRTRLDGQKVIEEEWMLTEFDRRIRDVQVHRDGSVWLLTEHEDGEVLRVSPAKEKYLAGR